MVAGAGQVTTYGRPLPMHECTRYVRLCYFITTDSNINLKKLSLFTKSIFIIATLNDITRPGGTGVYGEWQGSRREFIEIKQLVAVSRSHAF